MNRTEAAFDRRRRDRTGARPQVTSVDLDGRVIPGIPGVPGVPGAPAAPVIPFVVGGHPTLEATGAVLTALAAEGAPVIEIGVPFSDPIADGPTISEAMCRAIEGGVTPGALLRSMAPVIRTIESAVILMVSTSIVERIGREAFVRQAAEAGVAGVILPDLDLDEAEAVGAICSSHGLTLSLLAAPATGPERLRAIAALSTGFIYLLARQGVTGDASSRVAEGVSTEVAELERRARELRALTTLPIICGFGISTAAQVATVAPFVDGIVVGSAFVRAIDAAASPRQAAECAVRLLHELAPDAAAPR